MVLSTRSAEAMGMAKVKKFKGNDRFLMFLCRDIRRRWMQYGENRPYDLKAKKNYTVCARCPNQAVEWDHIDPVGKRVYKIEDLPDYVARMLFHACQPLCRKCNSKKGAKI